MLNTIAYNFHGDISVLGSDVFMQGSISEAHLAAVGAGERLGLFGSQCFPSIVQV